MVVLSWFIKKSFISYHPPVLVRVKPNLDSLSTDTRIPTIPRPCGDTTCPLITATRLNWKKSIRLGYVKLKSICFCISALIKCRTRIRVSILVLKLENCFISPPDSVRCYKISFPINYHEMEVSMQNFSNIPLEALIRCKLHRAVIM